MTKKRVGVLTGGGDCPGLNAVIRGVTKTAMNRHGMEVIGFYDGFLGLMEGRFSVLTDDSVSGILTQGGTILGTSNKGNPFGQVVESPDGERRTVDVSDHCMELYHDLGLSALICIGGDGTLEIGGKLCEKGAQVIGVPKTIDKDVVGTDLTFGFDSARTMATDAIDRLHTTADAHHRVMLVEVMGRNAGWLALESGIAGGGDVIIIPELPYDIEHVTSAIRRRTRFGKKFSIIVVAEGAKPLGGKQTYSRIVEDAPERVRLGGCSHIIAQQIEEEIDIETRVAVIGHLQRGGTPTAFDRLLATQYSVRAVEMVARGEWNHMVALRGSELVSVPIQEVVGKQALVPVDHPLIAAAISVGTSFGVDLEF